MIAPRAAQASLTSRSSPAASPTTFTSVRRLESPCRLVEPTARGEGLTDAPAPDPAARGDGRLAERERLVEVKTTACGRETPFFATRNALRTSAGEAPQYFLYRVFEVQHQPRLFHRQGQLDRVFSLDPIQYVASVL